jgi:hypothetical protein
MSIVLKEPDYMCCVCGKHGYWGDCHKHGFRLVANAIGYYACSEACDKQRAAANLARLMGEGNG